ncbi:hypothetical protein CFP56_023904 [Quercus suber]|uniref:Uncharacterized protein n=1 Tax=Quercus suber TaxID=58331 RepID=A0AAW0KAZ0_QUESU
MKRRCDVCEKVEAEMRQYCAGNKTGRCMQLTSCHKSMNVSFSNNHHHPHLSPLQMCSSLHVICAKNSGLPMPETSFNFLAENESRTAMTMEVEAGSTETRASYLLG